MKWVHAVALVATLALGACSSVPTVLGHCEVPPGWEANAELPPQLDTSKPMPRDVADAQWAKDRALATKNAKHADAWRDYVKANCQ
jgi:hypothetical protein